MKAMKKLIGILLMLTILVGTTLAFASCKLPWVKDECEEHVDEDNNGKCDNCDADVSSTQACTSHVDDNGDEKCDNCGADVPKTDDKPNNTCTSHVDANGDEKCDNCGANVPKPAPTPEVATYTISVVDEAGNPIKDAKVMIVNEQGYNAKVTGEDGKATYELMNNGNWKAQVMTLPDGYVAAAYDTKYDFVDGVATITATQPSYMIYTKFFDEDKADFVNVSGITYKVYAAENGEATGDALATVKSDALGIAVLDLQPGEYIAVAELTEDYAAAGIYELLPVAIVIADDSDSNNQWALISYKQGAVESYPEYLNDADEDGATEVVVPAGRALWYAVRNPKLENLVFNSADVVVTIGDKTYKAAEGETTVTVPVAGSDVMAPITMSITVADATVDTTVSITVEYVDETAGAVALVVGDNAINVTVESGYAYQTMVKFTATEAGTYTIAAAEGEENADVYYNDEWIENLPYEFTLEAGASIVFNVATTNYMVTEDVIDLVITKIS